MKFPCKLKYFDGKISQGFISLFCSKTIVKVAVGFFGIFLPIFLYNLFDKNFSYVIYYYLTGFLSYGLFIALGARFLNSFGFRRALRLSLVLGALNYLAFYFVDGTNYFYLIPLNLLILTLFRILHWLPYHVDFAKFTSKKNRSREVSLLAASTSILGIITPLLAGAIIANFGFKTLFVIGILLYLIALIPLVKIPKTRERFCWTYWQTWKQLFSKERRKIAFAFFADGAENVVGLVVWPIFIFEVLEGNYLEVGVISTLIIAATVVLELIVGKYADKKSADKKFLKYGSLLYSLGWILKIFIATALQVFLIDAYHKLMQIFTRNSFDALTYEIAADQGHFVDEFTVLHEMAISFGRVLMLLLILVISFLAPLNWTFILAALASILLNLIRSQTSNGR